MAYQSLTNSLYNPSATVGTAGSSLVLSDTTQSTDKDTGALIVEGGVGIEKDVNIGGALDTTGPLNVNDTTQSSSTLTGALIVDGGAAIAKNLEVGGTLTVGGTAVAAGGTGIGAVLLLDCSDLSVGSGSNADGDEVFFFGMDSGGNYTRGSAVGVTADKWQNISGVSTATRQIVYFQRVA